ncbi:MAG: hypothetical protein LQ345_000770 [Seirophora villosa]|nr:MAG: hypothetical protein LQ345_000770 [Seirophora villosa]
MSGLLHDENKPPPSPPPAPPLPPQRYGNRAASALARFAQPFIYASRPPSAHGDRPPETRALGLQSTSARSSRTGLPINALDISPTRTHAVLAGREILKTVRVSESSCTEDFNLRSSIVAYAAAHDSSGGVISARHKDQLAATDVTWSHGKYDTTIATAAANGQIVIYDINRPGVELARLHEHSRQVHRVTFSPFQGSLLLSGSQDATLRLWDLRHLARDESVRTCSSFHKYPGNNEGVRDARWSPTQGVEFAVGTDNGVVQRWDLRRPNVPLLKINAHEKTCYSVDWHPDGKHLASGGADKNIKIWDFSSTDRRMKTSWQLRAPKPVFNVRWRPAIWRSDDTRPGLWDSTQLATSYDNQDPRIHIWDLRRPSVPSRELGRFDTASSAMLWHSGNLLWSVDVSGIFTQTNLSLVNRLSDKQSLNTVAVAPNGMLASFLEKRSSRGTSIEEIGRNFVPSNKRTGSSGEKLGSSYSATEGSLEETSLFSSSFKARRRKAPSTQSSRSMAGTPPSAGSGGPVIDLDEALHQENLFHPAQIAACGRIRGVFETDAFAFLARHYHLKGITRTEPGDTILYSLPETLERNAHLAAYVGQYRLAQSWRIVALALQKELEGRADRNFARRSLRPSHWPRPDEKERPKGALLHTNETYRSMPVPPAASDKDPLKRPVATTLESGSNMATPLARPVPDAAVKVTSPSRTEEFDGRNSLKLPEARFTKQSPQKPARMTSALSRIRSPTDDSDSDQAHISGDTSSACRTANGSLHGNDQSMRGRDAAKENYRPVQRPVLRLEDSISTSGHDSLVDSFDRRDSNESFLMFSASTDSSHRARSMAGSLGSSQPSEGSDLAPQRWHEYLYPSTVHDSARLSASVDHRHGRPFDDHSGRLNDDSERVDSMSASARTMERPASGNRLINHGDTLSGDPGTTNGDTRAEHREQDAFIESDFLPSSSDPPPAPWTATAMLRPLLDYHLEQLSDVQLPAHLLLLLGSYIENNIPTALQTSILLTYHTQITSHSLHSQAAALRKVASGQYLEMAERGTYGIDVGGPWCTNCNKPSKGDKPGFCSRCHRTWADCPICDGHGPMSVQQKCAADTTEPNQAGDKCWGWCQGCGHGGHVGCLRIWWDDGDTGEGGCPTLGCLHDCTAGTRRADLVRQKAESKKGAAVKGDAWVVGQSRAVEQTAAALGKGGADKGGGGGAGGEVVVVPRDQGRMRSPRAGARSMASTGRTGSGGKKVRLLVPKANGETEARVGSPDGVVVGSQGKMSASSAPSVSYFSS